MKSTTKQGFKKFLEKRQMSSIVLRPTDEHEVIKILIGLSNNISPGYIDIPVTLIKETKFVITRYLLNLFKKYITNDTFFDILKVAKVVALHKEGFKSELSNYRLHQYYRHSTNVLKKYCINALQISGRKTIISPIVNLALEKTIQPPLLSLICMKQFCKSVMTIDRFVAFFLILRRHSTVSIIKFW